MVEQGHPTPILAEFASYFEYQDSQGQVRSGFSGEEIPRQDIRLDDASPLHVDRLRQQSNSVKLCTESKLLQPGSGSKEEKTPECCDLTRDEFCWQFLGILEQRHLQPDKPVRHGLRALLGGQPGACLHILDVPIAKQATTDIFCDHYFPVRKRLLTHSVWKRVVDVFSNRRGLSKWARTQSWTLAIVTGSSLTVS